MQDNNELQEFELDDLISEFQDPSEVSDDAGELTGELADLLGDWGTEETAAPMDTIRMNDLISQLTSGEAPASETGPEAETAPASVNLCLNSRLNSPLLKPLHEYECTLSLNLPQFGCLEGH